MYLEHINLVVNQLDKALAFYQAAFPHWHVRALGTGTWHGKARQWIHLGDDRQYIALSDHGQGNNRQLPGHQVGLAHFAYVVSDLAAVIERLTRAGFPLMQGDQTHRFRKNAYFVAPDGFEVKFVQYSSDIPTERNSAPN